MTITLLDFSQRPELGLHGSVVADFEAVAAPLGVIPVIAGAFARDVHLLYAHGIDTQRLTEDLDFAFAVADWTAFETLNATLLASGAFTASGTAHRLRHRCGLPVDFVPFGRVETAERTIAWPPSGDVVMNVFGFREALRTAIDLVLPGDARTKIVSLPALALLKIVCWEDRHYRSPRKDAHDLDLILRKYLQAGNEERLWGQFLDWTQEGGFDYEHAGARMLGHDVRALLDRAGVDRVSALLSKQVDPDKPGRLPSEMNIDDPDRARALLDAVLRGLLTNGHA